MTERPSDITDELLVLYELALASGQSLNPRVICRDLVSTLLARKDISFAAVWLWAEPKGSNRSAAVARLYHAAPLRLVAHDEIASSHPSFVRLRAVPVVAVDPSDCDHTSYFAGATAVTGPVAFFRLSDIGAFEIGTNRGEPFTVRELNQLQGVMEHFSVALEGALAHERLLEEVAERRRVENSLMQTYAELEREIDTRKRTADNLLKTEARFRDVAEIASDWIWETNRDHRFTYFSERMRELIPALETDLLGKTYEELIQSFELSAEDSGALLREVDAQRSFRNLRYNLRLAGGQPVNLAVSGKAKFDAQGRFQGYRGTARDITVEVDGQVLARRNERLATIGQLTGTVSHELRNPLGVISTSARFLQQLPMAEDARAARALSRIVRSTERCNRIIGELLSYGRTRGLQRRPLVIDKWLGELVNELTLPDQVILDMSLNAGVTLALDAERLRQAVANVIDNACQSMTGVHEHAGGKLRVSSFVREAYLGIAVCDSGVGMSGEVLEQAFEPLFSTRTNGFGLGLPLVKQVLEQHGGDAEIESGPERGTTVTLWLPLEQ